LAQKFYPHTVDQDGTWGTDARKLNDVSGNATDATTVADFSTDTAQGTIVIDPYTSRSTRGTTNEADFGWAVNAAGADGMGSTATAKRIIPAGTWTFNCVVSVTSAQTGIGMSNTTVTAVVYRVSSTGTRTELFRQASAVTTVTALIGVGVQTITWTKTGATQVTLEADETVFVSYQILSVGVAVTGQQFTWRTKGDGTDDMNTWVQVPSPGVRTDYPLTVNVTCVGTAIRDALAAAHTASVTAVGTATVDRATVAAKTVNVTCVGTASKTLAITPNPVTVTAVGTVSGRMDVPMDKLPGASDFSGTDPSADITGTVYTEGGAVKAGATVKLFRQSDDLKVAETTSAADGTYTFTRDSADPNTYFVLAFHPTDSPQVHGVSDRGVTPA
jgi:hypothetical protein